MSSVDISALGQLTPSVPLDVTKYPAATAKSDKPKFTLPPAAVYTLRVPTTITVENFGKSAAGGLKFQFDTEIVDGPFAGAKVRYQRLSATPYERDGVTQSMLGNLVLATGATEFPGVGADGNAQPQVDAVVATAGKTFKAYLNWEAKDTKFGTGLEIKGMKNFPVISPGVHQSFITIDGQTDAQGRPARVWANLNISNFEIGSR